MIRVVRAQIDAVQKQSITELRDSFGHKHLVQTNLLAPGADPAKDVAEATALLQANEDAFIAALKAPPFNYTDEQIAALES